MMVAAGVAGVLAQEQPFTTGAETHIAFLARVQGTASEHTHRDHGRAIGRYAGGQQIQIAKASSVAPPE